MRKDFRGCIQTADGLSPSTLFQVAEGGRDVTEGSQD